MEYKFDYSLEKSLVLKEIRGVSFEEIIDAIKKGYLLDDINHFNQKKYPHQRIFIIKFKNYLYAVPYIINHKTKTIFLKTIYPNRQLKKKYL